MKLSYLLFTCVLLLSTTSLSSKCKAQHSPLYLVPTNDITFVDDLPHSSLIQAVKTQLRWLRAQPPETIIHFGQTTIPLARMVLSIEVLVEQLRKKPSPQQFDRFIKEHYHIYQAGGRAGKERGEILVTAYYEPTFCGDMKKTSLARWPIYRFPYKGADSNSLRATRAEIDNNRQLAGEELAWLNDPFDAYLLHIQGSGKILFPDGSIRAVRYAGNNGHPYKSLGKLFVDKGIFPLEEVNNVSIRSWLKSHPEQRQKMLQHNPRFIFFRWGGSGNPEGSSGLPLTPERSIAIDPGVLPFGTIAFLKSRQPLVDDTGKVEGWAPMHRFVFTQDRGAAIKGPGRVDLFLGAGLHAENSANVMREPGKLYFFLLKDLDSRENRSQ